MAPIILAACISTRQLTQAQNILNTISNIGAENTNFKTYYQLVITQLQNGLYYHNFSAADKATLVSIANSGTMTSYNAQAILQTYYGYNYTRIIEDFGNGGGSKEAEVINYTKDALLHVFPNPATDNFTIQYSGLRAGQKILEVYSFDGRKVQQRILTDLNGQVIINAVDLQAGIYNCVLKQNNTIMSTSKIVVIK